MSAVNVINLNSKGELILKEETLKSIFLHHSAENKNIVVISITGLLRKGKTTILNLIKIGLENDWNEVKMANKPINGFLAMPGCAPVTKGIMMWSEPIITIINGEEVAVFLIDTEGTHEAGSSYSSASAIFSLTGLISSVQIFNVPSTIDQRDIELLSHFGGYGKEISKAIEQEKPFQKLVILIRDWANKMDIPYGQTSLKEVIIKTSRKEKSEEWISISKKIEESYNEYYCQLLPFPGEKIAFSTYGCKSDNEYIDFKEEFIDIVRDFIDDLLLANIIKKHGGKNVKNCEIYYLFMKYYNVFKSGEVVAPDSIFKVNIRLAYENTCKMVYDFYTSIINIYEKDEGVLITPNEAKKKMELTLLEANKKFKLYAPKNYKELETEYFDKLIANISFFNYVALFRIKKIDKWREVAVVGTASIATAAAVNVNAYGTSIFQALTSFSYKIEGDTQSSIADIIDRLKEIKKHYNKKINAVYPVEDIKYKKLFTDFRLLGKGGYSLVYHAISNTDSAEFAVKKIGFEKHKLQEITKESNLLKELSSEFVVKCFDSWYERNYYADELGNLNLNLPTNVYYPYLLHIQMELCLMSLSDALNFIHSNKSNTYSSEIEFYVLSEIFFEILECVQYLHSQKPSVIHRDLKPQNILISSFNNNRCVKLSDFGLSTYHAFSNESHTPYVGTVKYKAPEMTYDTHYTSKVDMFSIGIISTDLFNIDFNSVQRNHYSLNAEQKFIKIKEIADNLVKGDAELRPECYQVLADKHQWRYFKDEISRNIDYKNIVSKTPKTKAFDENFTEYFIQNKNV